MTRADVARVALGTLLFLAGVAIGWLSRGMTDPSSGARLADASSGSHPNAAGASDGTEDGSVSNDGGRSAAERRGSADAVPEGQGDVAVVGAEGELPDGTAEGGATEGSTEGGASPSASGEGAPAGRLDASSIRDVVRAHRSELGFCFAWQLHQHPELAGRLTMEFAIGPDGRVIHSEVLDDALGDETVAECFVGVTRRMEFPPPEDGGEVTVRYPFLLSPDGDPTLDGGVADP